VLVLDTDKITGNEAIPYITGGNLRYWWN